MLSKTCWRMSGWVKKFAPVPGCIIDLPAQHGPEFFSLRQSVSAKGYFTGDQAHISGQHTHDRLRDQRFAGSGLANEGQALPGKNMERNPADQVFFRAVQLCGDHAIIILQDRFLQVSLESTFLYSPARKNYVGFFMKRCAVALESGRNIYNHIFNIGFHLEEASRGYFSGKIFTGAAQAS